MLRPLPGICFSLFFFFSSFFFWGGGGGVGGGWGVVRRSLSYFLISLILGVASKHCNQLMIWCSPDITLCG